MRIYFYILQLEKVPSSTPTYIYSHDNVDTILAWYKICFVWFEKCILYLIGLQRDTLLQSVVVNNMYYTRTATSYLKVYSGTYTYYTYLTFELCSKSSTRYIIFITEKDPIGL